MGISLQKGGNVSLTKEAPGLSSIVVGLGWDVRATHGAAFDLDTAAFLLTDGEKVRTDQDFIFYNQPKSTDGSVEHLGDNLTGAGEGDDEEIRVALDQVPAAIQKLAITVTIHDAEARGQNFGMVANAFIRVVNAHDNTEIARYDLSEDYSIETALVFGEVYKRGDEWKFRAVGQGYTGGLAALATQYGVNVG
ncbi:MAG: chemical-damaging agent resistance protein C [Candidatus Entotheonella factor]|uniref:Chemical-damaging agent resistance protein C n=1 Tax=Entotheonella factor TaxID=1429438 RepID=W4L379_ENTF1|nr:TerD family protein [Candidatus Entotheonella palauensis]ETW92135.1 MAG: chemical-damaging agent resistance protein C [Candidatus Entotheonella factor]